MAVEAVGATGTALAVSRNSVTPVGRSAASGGGQANSAASTIVVSKVTVTNADGSTTTTITYADGHTETETTPAKLSGKQQGSGGSAAGYGSPPRQGVGSQSSAGGSSGGSAAQTVSLGSLVDILA